MGSGLGIAGLHNAVPIGQGGYGTVYSADEPEFGRTVAVKVLHDRLDDEEVRRAFVSECRAMGALSGHPHIVTVHRGGSTEDREPYIVMDLMSAGSLADRTGRDGPLPWAEVLEVGVTVAGALETAHRAGILHLDIKPANILVSRYGEAKLGDFGISRLPGVTGTSADGRIRASATYTAPERLIDGTATPRSDLYGLGATMFALLTGRPAFAGDPGEDLLATLARIVRDPTPDLRPRGVPDVVCRVVERLMAKSPADRFASAADAAAAMQAAQRGSGRPATRAVVEGSVVEGRAPTHGDTATWPAYRHPPITPAAATVVGMALPRFPTTAGPAPAAPPLGIPPARPAAPARPHQPAALLQPAAPPRPAAPRPGRGRAVAVAGAALVVVLVAVGLAVLLSRPVTGRGSAAGPPAPTTTTASAVTTTTPAPDPPADGVVAVAAGASHPQTEAARQTLGGYVSGVNESRYADAFALLHPDSDTAQGGLEAWQDGQSTTFIDTATITSVRDTGPDALEAVLTFTSYQSAEFGPEGQTCTNWNLAYDLVGPPPGWLILRARALTPPQAC